MAFQPVPSYTSIRGNSYRAARKGVAAGLGSHFCFQLSSTLSGKVFICYKLLMSESQQDLQKQILDLKEELKDIKYENRIKALEDKIDNDDSTKEGDQEFSAKFNDYKTAIVASIFLDFFFIFTIIAIVKSSQLDNISKQKKVSVNLLNSLSTWRAIFVVIFILKVIGLIAIAGNGFRG